MNTDLSLNFRSRGEGQKVVFSHGTPTYSGEYNATVSFLEKQYQCILIDHLGFGGSPKPKDADYSLSAHQRRFRETLLTHQVISFHLVVHDFGGVIALPLLFDPQFNILSLTILNSWYWPLNETEPQMAVQKYLVQSGIFPFLYRYLNFSPKVLLKMAWGKYAPLTKARHLHYISQFPTSEQRSGTIGFLRALFDFDLPEWKNSDRLSSIQQPVQVIWGEADQLVSGRNLERWKKIFPKAKIVVLKDVGHFVADEAPELLAKELLGFF